MYLAPMPACAGVPCWYVVPMRVLLAPCTPCSVRFNISSVHKILVTRNVAQKWAMSTECNGWVLTVEDKPARANIESRTCRDM